MENNRLSDEAIELAQIEKALEAHMEEEIKILNALAQPDIQQIEKTKDPADQTVRPNVVEYKEKLDKVENEDIHEEEHDGVEESIYEDEQDEAEEDIYEDEQDEAENVYEDERDEVDDAFDEENDEEVTRNNVRKKKVKDEVSRKDSGKKDTNNKVTNKKGPDNRESVKNKATKTNTEKRDSNNKKQSAKKSTKNDSNGKSGKDTKKKKKIPGFFRFLIVLAIIAFVLLVAWFFIFKNIYKSVNFVESKTESTAKLKENGVTNILLIGNDAREGVSGGRSDAMIILSISDATNSITLTSLLRDIYVEIPGYEGNRLNAAYSFGGADLLVETIENNFDIPIAAYVEVDFETFVTLVDAVNGVDLELSAAEKNLVNAYLWEYNMIMGNPDGTYNIDASTDGMVHLNGPQALAYCRDRYIGSDFGRTERQRKVLSQALKKLPKAVIKDASVLTDELLPNLSTNLSDWNAYLLSFSAPKFLTYETKQISIPKDGTYSDVYIRNMAVLQVDFDKNIEYMKQEIYGENK